MADDNEEKKANSDFKFFDSMQGNFKGKLSTEDHIIQFIYIIVIVFALMFFMTCNFIAMSASLNINKDNKSSVKYFYALGAFMFGFMYIIGYLMFFRIGQRNETIEFDREKLFPL